MATPTVRHMLGFLLPGGLIFAATVVASQQTGFHGWVAPLQPLYPYAVAIIALLIGWRFDRSRLVFATAIMALAAGFLAMPQLPAPASEALKLLLPLNLALLAALRERGIFTLHGILRWLFILAQPAVVWALLSYGQAHWLGHLNQRFIPLDLANGLALSHASLTAFGIALLMTAYLGIRRHNALDSGLFWATGLSLYALLTTHDPAMLNLFLATALLILVIAVIEISHGMAFRDELTGLPGRRALNEALVKLGSRYTVAMVDVDHFKKFNDRYGHDIGDEVLKMVAGKLAQVAGGGKAFRYGGEEFSILFAGKSLDEAHPHLEDLRESIATYNFSVRNKKRPKDKPTEIKKSRGTPVNITVSIGVAERLGEKNPHEVIKAADKALYKAKKGGRNRVAR